MAVPTISAVTPNVGPTRGRVLVQITGTNFRARTQLPVDPATGKTPKGPDPVRVTIGDVVVPLHARLSATELLVLIPKHERGTFDVTVENLDDAGVPIPGETATLAGAFRWKRPPLSGAGNEHTFVRVIKALEDDLKLCVYHNVHTTVSVDWDPTPGDRQNYIEVGEVPALVLMGPRLSRTTLDVANVNTYQPGPDNTFKRRRTKRLYDLEFDVVGLADKQEVLLNLLGATLDYFDQNPDLVVQRDPADASKGTISYMLELTGDFSSHAQPDESDRRHFVGACTIRAVDLEDLPGFVDDGVDDRGKTLDKVTLQPITQKG